MSMQVLCIWFTGKQKDAWSYFPEFFIAIILSTAIGALLSNED
tara:strand:- start:517 stop:645 length:129 start_codon:yes stop_codon:yes gene_type:complete